MTVAHNFGIHRYHFPDKQNGLLVDLSYTLPNRFVAEEHHIEKNAISGWIDTQTTCSAGVYGIYYYLVVPGSRSINTIDENQFMIEGSGTEELEVKIGFSSVSEKYARERVNTQNFDLVKSDAQIKWKSLLTRVSVSGEKDREDLFYSLLYRGLQAPCLVSEEDGFYKAIDGSVQQKSHPVYNGWAIWDNYRE